MEARNILFANKQKKGTNFPEPLGRMLCECARPEPLGRMLCEANVRASWKPRKRATFASTAFFLTVQKNILPSAQHSRRTTFFPTVQKNILPEISIIIDRMESMCPSRAVPQQHVSLMGFTGTKKNSSSASEVPPKFWQTDATF